MMATKWGFGDRVINVARPEWGAGVVTKAAAATHEGRPCQHLTIRFDRAGLKSISTAFARLKAAENGSTVSAESTPSREEAPALRPEALDEQAARERLVALPEAATDPFSSPLERFKATLALYRFSPSGASLLDWAASQTGLSDPLSHFSRHELEELFRRFSHRRDEHLRTLAGGLVKQDPSRLAEAVSGAPGAARQALKRLHVSR